MPLRIVHVDKLMRRNASSIVDEYVDGAEALHCRRNQSLNVRQLLNIARHGQQISPGLFCNCIARFNEEGVASGTQDNSHPFLCQGVGGGIADSLAGTVTIATFPCKPKFIVSPHSIVALQELSPGNEESPTRPERPTFRRSCLL